MNLTLWILIVAVLTFSFSAPIFAAGVLDPAFGSGGQTLFRFNGAATDDMPITAKLQPDGKIVIVGVTNLTGQSNGFRDFAVARLNSDGTFDKTFGTGGKVSTNFPGVVSTVEDVAHSLIIQPDGKLMVGGTSASRIALARYNSDGSLDTTFGTGGKLVYDLPESSLEGGNLVTMNADGKYLIATGTIGVSPEPPNQIIFLRFNHDGQLDTTFGTNGKFKILLGRLTYFGGVSVLPDGKLIVGATYVYTEQGCVPTHNTSCDRGRNVIMRYHPDLRPDRKFGINGRLATIGSAPQVLSDGHFIFGGDPIKRYYSNGYFQSAFDNYMFSGQNANFNAGNLKEMADGKVVACGALNGGNGYDDFGLVLFSPDGHVIGTDRRDFFTANDWCNSLLVQPDGKVVLVGTVQTTQQGPRSFLVMRYTGFTL